MLSGTPRTFVGATTFVVRGLTDRLSRDAVADRITSVAGVDSVTVDLDSAVVTVRASRPVDRADVVAAVEAAGFTVAP
jgi:copper chaperone CopZ